MHKVNIEGSPNLVRDIESHAIINTDSSGYNAYITQRNALLSVSEQGKRLNKLESEIGDIKSMLEQLISMKG